MCLSHFSPQGQYGNYQQWEMVTATHTALLWSLSEFWPLVIRSADFNDGCSSLRFLSQTQTYNTQKYNIRFLFRLLNMPVKCILFIMSMDSIMSKSMNCPLVQYVSKQQCLKNGTALSFSIADCETKLTKILDIRDDLNVQFQSTVVHCFSII